MAKPEIIIYTTPTCPWCQLAKEFMEDNKIAFKERDISSDDKARAEMVGKSKQMGVPVLDVGGKIIVGFDAEAIQKAVGNQVAYIKNVASQSYYPGIVEKRLIIGKSIYFNYDPAATPGVWQNTLEYLR